MANIFCVKIDKWYLIVGTAQKDGEIKKTNNGNEFGAFSLYLGKDETRPQGQQNVYADCISWDGLEYIASIRKGDRVFACGEIRQREYKGKTYNDFICKFAIAMKHPDGYVGASAALESLADAAQAMGVPVSTGGADDFTPIENDDGLPF